MPSPTIIPCEIIVPLTCNNCERLVVPIPTWPEFLTTNTFLSKYVDYPELLAYILKDDVFAILAAPAEALSPKTPPLIQTTLPQ